MISTKTIKNIFACGLILILSTAMQACGGGGGGSGNTTTSVSPSLLWDQSNWNEANWE